MKQYQLAVLNYMEGLPPGRLLDAASGADALGRALKDKGFDVFSLDLYGSGALAGRFVRADMNAGLPYGDASFDYVLCSESLQYMENHSGLFREFRRVLKKGGGVVISMPNLLSASSRLYFLQRGYFPHFKPVRTVDSGKEWDSIAYNPISLVEVMELVKRGGFELAGLKATSVKYSNAYLYPVLKGLYSLGLLFEKNEAKAEFLRHLSSRDVLLGDHLVVHMRLRG